MKVQKQLCVVELGYAFRRVWSSGCGCVVCSRVIQEVHGQGGEGQGEPVLVLRAGRHEVSGGEEGQPAGQKKEGAAGRITRRGQMSSLGDSYAVTHPPLLGWPMTLMQAFKDGDVRFLICTDVAARGTPVLPTPLPILLTHTCSSARVHRHARVRPFLSKPLPHSTSRPFLDDPGLLGQPSLKASPPPSPVLLRHRHRRPAVRHQHDAARPGGELCAPRGPCGPSRLHRPRHLARRRRRHQGEGT